jgi:hypothetical protein
MFTDSAEPVFEFVGEANGQLTGRKNSRGWADRVIVKSLLTEFVKKFVKN